MPSLSRLNPANLIDFNMLSEAVSERYAYPLVHPTGTCSGGALRLLPESVLVKMLGLDVVTVGPQESQPSGDTDNHSKIIQEYEILEFRILKSLLVQCDEN